MKFSEQSLELDESNWEAQKWCLGIIRANSYVIRFN